ncbi:hypothetical protein VD659_14435 [Herbiconiux sp. 11R-BC]|uniref:hypothetical protein n=1 Tax=Herbiconiux sp. 11R-BC TaxID=3111637 RepID=UPI003C02F809
MILHAVALGFAVVELALTSVARRARPRSTAALAASVAMVAAMADGGLFGPPVLPSLAWTAILVAGALGIALWGRLRAASGHGAPVPRGALDPALGLIAMAFLPLLGSGHTAESVGGHGHGSNGAALLVLLLGLLAAIAVSAIRSWLRRSGGRNAVVARACMLCSLTTMMAAVVR